MSLKQLQKATSGSVAFRYITQNLAQPSQRLTRGLLGFMFARESGISMTYMNIRHAPCPDSKWGLDVDTK